MIRQAPSPAQPSEYDNSSLRLCFPSASLSVTVRFLRHKAPDLETKFKKKKNVRLNKFKRKMKQIITVRQ